MNCGLIQSIQDFSVSLYTELATNNNGNNIFFSPLSIHVILFITSYATIPRSITFKEIYNAIKLNEDCLALLEYQAFIGQFTMDTAGRITREKKKKNTSSGQVTGNSDESRSRENKKDEKWVAAEMDTAGWITNDEDEENTSSGQMDTAGWITNDEDEENTSSGQVTGNSNESRSKEKEYEKWVTGEVDENIKLVNGLFVDTSKNINDTFQKDSQKYFNTYIEMLDFKNKNSNEHRQQINEWISGQTENKIVELFPEGSINSLTSFVSYDALRFNNGWENQFHKIPGHSPFYINSKNSVNVEMMELQTSLEYYYDDNLKYAALRLPFQNRSFSMIILLPDNNDLENLENKLPKIKLPKLLNEMSRRNVKVYLPRFKLENSLDLNKTLSKLGCSTMFKKGEANLTKLSNEAWVDTMMHKACINVGESTTEATASVRIGPKSTEAKASDLIGEKVTEAAAPTGASIQKTETASTPLELKEFNADHPFIFFILTEDGKILFIGRIAQFDKQPTIEE